MKKKTIITTFTLLLLLVASPIWAAPVLSIDSVTGFEGDIVTVGVNYTADSPAITGGNPVAIKFTMNFTPSLAEAGTPVAGLSLAGDHVQFSNVDNVAGTLDVIIVPPAKNIALSNGQVLQVPFRLKSAGVSSTNTGVRSPLTLSSLEMSNAISPITIGAPINGALIIKDPQNTDTSNNTLSDGFNATTLDETQWLYLNPLGDGAMTFTGSQLALNVPGGSVHHFGSSNDTVRVMQPVVDEDFAMKVKFDSLPTKKYQVQGIIVEQDANTLLRFEIYSDGTKLNLYAGGYRNGKAENLYNAPLTGAANAPLYLLVERVGQQWVVYTSYDGVSWQEMSRFMHGLMANEVGVYAGNAGTPPPAFTALIDDITLYAASMPTPRVPPLPDTVAPTISEVSTKVRAGSGGGVDVILSWTTDEPTTGSVAYGETTSYETGSATSQSATEHSVTMTGLVEDALYYYQVTATDASGNSSTVDLAATTTIPVPNSNLSDVFNASSLDATQWLYLDPLNDGSMSLTGSQLALSVPAGEHYFGASNDTVRVMQPIVDEDFVMDVKFDSLPTKKFQVQGILVEQDANTLLRFEIYSDGNQLKLYTASYRNGTSDSQYNAPLASGSPLYLRVERVGQQWTVSTSFDGVAWQEATSFVHALVANEVGVYAGNTGSTPPAFTALIDEITLYAASSPPPRVPPPVDTVAPVISDVFASVRAADGGAEVILSWTTDEPTTSSVAYGETTSYEVGSSTSAGTTEHSVTLTGLIEGTLYHYQVTATDASGNSSATTGLSIATTIVLPNGSLSDGFNVTGLDETQWLYLNPLGDGIMSFTGNQLALSVPAGEHYFGSSNNTVRVMQPIVDEDFVMEVKFDSLPTKKYQVQGILVEQNASTLLRFEIYSDGNELSLYAANYRNGVSTSLYNAPLASSSPLYLRVVREGRQWTVSTSFDGVTWQEAASFAHTIVVNEVGVYAGNTGSTPPAFTALIDDITLYAASVPMLRTPPPSDTVAPVINDLSTSVRAGSGGGVDAIISWRTDEFSTGGVIYGETTNYEVGSVSSPAAMNHSVTLTGLAVGVLYHYQVTALDASGNSSSTADFSVTTTIPVPHGSLSDAFNVSSLDATQWLYLDPLSDGSMSLTGSQLALSVPAGEHYFSASNDTVRVMQPVIDEDFVMDVKFDSLPTERYQMQGILVEQDANTLLRFEIYSDGNQLKLYTASYRNGSSDSQYNAPLTSSSPLYLRVERAGQQWTVFTSSDGVVWQEAISFAHALVANEVGVYAGNTGSAPPAFIALIDEITFYAASTPPPRVPDTAAPDTVVPSVVAPVISGISSSVRAGIGGVEVIINWATDKPTTSRVAYGETTSYEVGGATSQGEMEHSVTLTGLIEDALYYFQVTATDANGNSSTLDLSVVGTIPVLNGVLSDGFNITALDVTQWLYLNPLGDGAMSLSGSQLALSVPAGEHYFGSSNNTVRVMQPIVDEDFVMEVKFDSLPTKKFQMQGIIIEQDVDSLLRFEIYSDGSQLNLYATSDSNGISESLYHAPLASSSPLYLRVARAGRQWTASTSFDGVVWQVASRFVNALVVNEIGVYAGNTGSISPAFTALIDDITIYAASVPTPRPPPPPDTVAPVINDVSASVRAAASGGVEVILSWTTDELTTGSVAYGETTSYEVGSVATSQGAAIHSVILTGLTEDASYYYQITAIDSSDNSSSTTGLSITVTIPVPNSRLSDGFNATTLDETQWLYLNPLGDGSMSLTGNQLALSVPAGEHYFGSSNDTVRVIQPIVDEDFVVDVKFDSLPTERYQMQGILVEQDANTLLRFEIYSDGNQLKLYTASYRNGTSSSQYNAPLASGSPLYLRVERVAQQWTVSTSFDGMAWQEITSFFNDLVARDVGVYVGNSGGTSPAFTALIDDVSIYAASVPMPDAIAPIISNIKSEIFGTWIVLTWETNELTFGSAQYGQTLIYGLGSVDSDNGIYNSHRAVIGNLEPNTVYNVQVISTDRAGNTTSSQNHIVTSGDVLPEGPILDVWYSSEYNTDQTFGVLGSPQSWVNILGNVRSMDSVQSLTYSLNGQADKFLTIGPNDTRLASKGDFNVDIATSDLVEGLNTVVVTSTDTLGNTTSESITLNYQTGNVWPGEYSIDWANTTAINDVAQVVDGLWKLEGDSIRVVEPGYDRLVAIGDVAWTDYEVTVPVTVYGLAADGYDAPSNGPGIGLGMRWSGHTVWDDTTQPSIGWYSLGAIGWYRWHYSDGERLMISGTADANRSSTRSFQLQLGVTYMFKMRVVTIPGQGGRYWLKVWEMGQPEPTLWDLTLQESLADPQFGSILLIAHEVDARFGNVTIVPLN